MIYIYKVTNKINNKIYIGQTNNFHKRQLEHYADNRTNHQAFKRALNKYKREDFEWKIIDVCISREEANKAEKYYIKLYNSKVPHGYNIASGGEGGSNWNIKLIVMLDLDGKFIKKYDCIAQCENETGLDHSMISACCKGKHLKYKDYIFMYEKDYLEKGPRKYIKPKSKRCKKILQYNLDGVLINEYNSIYEASQLTKINYSNIHTCLRKRSKSGSGYIWTYDYEEKPSKWEVRKDLKIEQYDLSGNKIREFLNCREASRFLGLNDKSALYICEVLDKENRTAYGYKWKHVESRV